MNDYAPGDLVTIRGNRATVLRRLSGTEFYAVDYDNGDHDVATAEVMVPADPRIVAAIADR